MARTDPDRTTADELTAMREFLDYHRATIVMKVEGLTDVQAATGPISTTTLTLAGLVRHLALVEDHWFTRTFAGDPLPEPWAAAPFSADPDWDFHSADDAPLAESLALYADACARSDAVLARAVAEHGVAAPDVAAARSARGVPPSLRWIMLHMVEETARHNGHADLLREAIDGVVGE